jgi:hypothetical protein
MDTEMDTDKDTDKDTDVDTDTVMEMDTDMDTDMETSRTWDLMYFIAETLLKSMWDTLVSSPSPYPTSTPTLFISVR